MLLTNFPVDELTDQDDIEYEEYIFVASDEVINWWAVYSNGSHGRSRSGIGCLVVSPSGKKVEKAIRLGFKASTNEVEYEETIHGL